LKSSRRLLVIAKKLPQADFEQQINSGIECFNDGGAYAVLVDGAHHEIVRDDDTLITPFIPNEIVNDALGVRRRPFGIDSL
jgi:hypothetical protein